MKALGEAFGREPECVWAAPGRVNLIGEHTDYNDGFVLPFALPHRVVAAAAGNGTQRLRVVSVQRDRRVEVDVDGLAPGAVEGWAAYVVGVVWALRDAGHRVGGLDLVVDGDVPSGAGLSSSAALECAVALAVDEVCGLGIERSVLARLAQRAENDFVGVPCGIMDQSASLLCTDEHVLFLDTRSGEIEQVPLDLDPAGLALLVVDTRAPHRLADGEYAARRRDCERGAAALGVPYLRDVAADDLPDALARIDDDTTRRRVRHVVTENARVLEVVERLRAGRVGDIGPLLSASHESLRDDFEVTVPELDTAVAAALGAGARGARMTGGGFGGCVIALVEADRSDRVADAVRVAFAERGFTAPEWFLTRASPGAHRLGR
ncbi:MAG TPA: galactokinase [Nocardioidaceae bacterium]|nr:galactokinase [Nocardioidaceae bacterium]